MNDDELELCTSLSYHERKALSYYHYWHRRARIAEIRAIIIPTTSNRTRLHNTLRLEKTALKLYFITASSS